MLKLFSVLIGATFKGKNMLPISMGTGEHILSFDRSPLKVLIHGFASVEWLACGRDFMHNKY